MITRRLKRAEKIISDAFNDNTIILQLADGAYFELNDSGTDIWKMIPTHDQEPINIEQLTSRITAEFEIESRAELMHFVHDFVIDLEQNNLISISLP